jgi:hypothetical protein
LVPRCSTAVVFACALTACMQLGRWQTLYTSDKQRTPPTLAGSTRGVKNAHILAKYRKDEHKTWSLERREGRHGEEGDNMRHRRPLATHTRQPFTREHENAGSVRVHSTREYTTLLTSQSDGTLIHGPPNVGHRPVDNREQEVQCAVFFPDGIDFSIGLDSIDEPRGFTCATA